MEKLHATIGRLKVENDFLQQVSMSMKIVPLLLTKSVPVKYKNF